MVRKAVYIRAIVTKYAYEYVFNTGLGGNTRTLSLHILSLFLMFFEVRVSTIWVLKGSPGKQFLSF